MRPATAAFVLAATAALAASSPLPPPASAAAATADALAAADARELAGIYDPYDPSGTNPPRTVYVDFQLTTLRLVDARQSSFSASGILYYAWRDDTLLTSIAVDGKPYGPPSSTNNLFWPNHVPEDLHER